MYISRFGGDEFLIHISGEFNKKSIEAMLHKILKQFETELVIDNIEYFVSFSIGITSYPIDSNEITQLLMYADTAMYKAKQTGKNKYMFFCNNMMVELQNKKQIEIILRNALKTNGFTLVYQPQTEVSSGEIIGFEALLRLKDADIPPLKFIPVAEETGLIIDIGRWVTGEVINQLVHWKNKSFHLKPIAINYSSKQLADMEYVNYMAELLKEKEIDPKYIEIEITESILLENSEETHNFLGKLKELGIRIALDDFGTGYSSLNYLTYIPVDKIKLDKALCEKFLRLDNIKVMNSLISLAHSLDLVITAEGIELMEQYERLKLGGCDYIQGYLFSKPLNNSDIEKIYHCNMLHRIEILDKEKKVNSLKER
jgi:EAL domain-containing protein (putative c-di-GMP-specific phosphodiesterase class I)